METTERSVTLAPGRTGFRLARSWMRLGFSPLGVAIFVVFALLPLIPPFNREDYVRWEIGAALLAAEAIAFDFTAGYIGVVNFGFAAFVGLVHAPAA